MSIINQIWRKNIWKEIKEDRVSYYVNYNPINLRNHNFANLQLVFTETLKTEQIAVLMENELKLWITRFPLPIMVTSFDAKGDLISLEQSRPNNELIGYILLDTNEIIASWDKPYDELKQINISDEHLNRIYQGLPYETREEKEQGIVKDIKEKRKIKQFVDITLLIWLGISILIAFLGWKNYWVGAGAFVYTLYKTIRRGLQLIGYKTRKELEISEVEGKKEHCYYHCELNSIGFAKLKAENFERQEREQIQLEKEMIRLEEKSL